MKSDKLHITFGVIRLTDEKDQLQAKQVLNDCVENIIKFDYFRFNLKTKPIIFGQFLKKPKTISQFIL